MDKTTTNEMQQNELQESSESNNQFCEMIEQVQGRQVEKTFGAEIETPFIALITKLGGLAILRLKEIKQRLNGGKSKSLHKKEELMVSTKVMLSICVQNLLAGIIVIFNVISAISPLPPKLVPGVGR